MALAIRTFMSHYAVSPSRHDDTFHDITVQSMASSPKDDNTLRVPAMQWTTLLCIDEGMLLNVFVRMLCKIGFRMRCFYTIDKVNLTAHCQQSCLIEYRILPKAPVATRAR